MRNSRAADGAEASSALLAARGPEQTSSEPEDQDTGDVPSGVDEDALNDDELDTDQITNPD